MAKSSKRNRAADLLPTLAGWQGWSIQPDLLTDPDGNHYTPAQLRAVWLNWQLLSAQRQQLNQQRAMLAALMAAQPSCPRPWHRRAAPRPPAPAQLPLELRP